MAQVPLYAPATRAQWSAWTQLWPLYWNAPSPKTGDPEAKLPTEDEAELRHWMAMALEEALQASREGSAENAAVIVDPCRGGVRKPIMSPPD